MASPQKENGYTPIANEIMEALLKYTWPPKTGLPLRLSLYVIRKTYGYHKKMDIISLSQFQEATNEKNRTNLIYWLNYLVQAKILVKIKKSNSQVEYGFNKDYDQWLSLVQVRTLVQTRPYSSASTDTSASNSTRTSASTDTETSASTDTHKRKKEKKEIVEQSSTPFSFKEKLDKIWEGNRKDLKIIARYFTLKGFTYDNELQYQSALKRELRPAKALIGYSAQQIDTAVEYCKKEYPEIWTLETLHKVIDKTKNK